MSGVTGRARSAGAEQAHGLAEELRRAGVREVDASTRRRAEYSSDASNYRVVPAAVVYPRHTDEVLAVLDVARRVGLPLTARGGGTSTAGNAIGPGVVVDFSRYLSAVTSVDPDTRTAVVEPGAVLDAITTAAAPFGLRFGPDPSTHARATIGGSIGNNACGARAMRYGRCADNVVTLDFLTGGGERFTAGALGEGNAQNVGVRDALGTLAQEHSALIAREFGRFTRQISGYSLEHLLPEWGANVARFLAGTEGTLGVILGATVALVDSPAAVALAVLGYPDMAAAADDVGAVLPHEPVAVEGMDATLVHVFRSRFGGSAVPDLPRGGGWLFVETAGDTEEEAVAKAERVIADASCIEGSVSTGTAARALWRIREDGAGLGSRTVSGNPAWPGWEDAAVPPDQLGDYLRAFFALMADHHLEGATFGHFGDGCIHARIDFPIAEDPRRFREFIIDAAGLVASHGGSMSGEHGDGRARSELLPQMYSPEAIELFGNVKRLFDPTNLCNPGVLVDPAPLGDDLRLPAAKPQRVRLGFAFPDDRGDFTAAVHRCVGVGKCRSDTTGTGGVMCPSYLATRDEKDSTRGRARVLQELANGSLLHDVRSPEVTESLDLCFACKGCSVDCPAAVDMATYKAEMLYQRYRGRIRPAAHYALGWIPRTARIASRMPRLANALLGARALTPLISRLSGIDPRRRMPPFARHRFRSSFAPRPDGEGRTVLLWVDTFTEHFTPEVGDAALRVLEAAGFSVEILPRTACCGLTWISTGQLATAKRELRRSLDALEGALGRGIPIVGLEPSCTAVFRRDARELLPDDPRAARAARAFTTVAELLADAPGWEAPDLSGVDVLAQPHCHHHAVMGWEADRALLEGAGATVRVVGGCCGFAGNFGMEKGHYDVSVAAAETALLPAVRGAAEGAVVLADGFSCKTQLAQLGDVDSRHLVELLAERIDGAEGPTR